jgi:hypothetical protein
MHHKRLKHKKRMMRQKRMMTTPPPTPPIDSPRIYHAFSQMYFVQDIWTDIAGADEL